VPSNNMMLRLSDGGGGVQFEHPVNVWGLLDIFVGLCRTKLTRERSVLEIETKLLA
jgi:hypothetical protein